MALMLYDSRVQLNLFLQTMFAEGLVNNNFLQLQSMKASLGRDFVIRTVISYWSAARNLFAMMSNQLDQNVIDFYDILACAHDMFERSNSIGAVRVSIACSDIFHGCNEYHKDCCINGLTTMKREFARLQVKFESVAELERDIIKYED